MSIVLSGKLWQVDWLEVREGGNTDTLTGQTV